VGRVIADGVCVWWGRPLCSRCGAGQGSAVISQGRGTGTELPITSGGFLPDHQAQVRKKQQGVGRKLVLGRRSV
jgi:hypothetical protein